MNATQRMCAVLVGVELGVIGWCAYAVARVYRSVKGRSG